jgi:ATP-dependent RNA helicase RhlB
MGLLSKLKSIFGIGGAKQSSTPNASQKQKNKQVVNEKRSKRNKSRSEGKRSDGQQRPGRRDRRESDGADANRGPNRSRSAKPRSAQPATTDESTAKKNHRKPREHKSTREPRIDHTFAQRERPGGAFTPEQIKAYAAAHAAWDLASYVVPEAEGKKRFVDFGLPGEILHAVADLDFQYCTPIQAQSLEFSLEGKNVAGRAQTGTGKTAAFLIAVLTRYLRTPERRNLKPGTPRALILAPTRELVIQICKDAEALGKYCGDVRSLAVYGGMDYDRQRRELEDAPVDILVATPGRLIDFVRNHIINLRQVDTLVIDEADRMLDMGFIPDVRAIVNRLPDRDNRCTMLYSATLNETVMNLAAMWMRDPVRVEIESETMTTETIRQIVYIARSEEKFTLLYNHLKKYADARTIIFCNRKFTTERICENLRRRGIACEMLSGDVNQVRRLKILEAFRAGEIRTVVATDVAGRGIHVDDIAFVVNYDFPYEPEDYVHRIGRTGRAGNTGTAISFADEDESFIIPDIEAYIKEPLKCVMPEEWMYEALPAPEARKNDRRHRASHKQAEDVPAEYTPSDVEDSQTPQETAEVVVDAPVTSAPEASDEPQGVTAEVASTADAIEVVVAVDPAPVVDMPKEQVVEPMPQTAEVLANETPAEPVVETKPEVVLDAVEVVDTPVEETAPAVATTTVEATIEATESVTVEASETAPAMEVKANSDTKPEKKPYAHRRHHVARPSGARKGGAVVARPQQPKEKQPQRTHMVVTPVTTTDVRPEREPRFKPHMSQRQNGVEHGQKERPPRSLKPVAKRWARHRPTGPRDGSESHHASPVVSRTPIYAPGTRGPIADEWTPGQS